MKKQKSPKLSRNYTHPHKPRYSQFHLSNLTNEPKGYFRVVSYNINWSRRIQQAVHLFETHPSLKHTDILCLQEMDHDGVKKIAQHLGFHYVYYPAVLHPRHNRDFGNAVLTRWPIVQDKKIILPNVPYQKLQRIAVRATVRIGDRDVVVFSIHTKVFMRPDHRSLQIEYIIKNVPKDCDTCVIAGDFNTLTKRNRSAILRSFINNEFTLANEDIGWTHKNIYLLNRKSFLDHIYVKGLKILSTGIVTDSRASDHFPIWADLM